MSLGKNKDHSLQNFRKNLNLKYAVLELILQENDDFFGLSVPFYLFLLKKIIKI
jgi:hypothetical protein